MKALIITGRGVQDQELVYPQYRLQEAGYALTIAADEPEFLGIQGVKFKATVSINDEAEDVGNYDVLVIPGGVKCMEHLRLSAAALHIADQHHRRGRVIGSVCSGAQLLITAGLVKGRTISAYPAMRVDVENAGATWHPGPVVVSGQIVSAPHYRNLGDWMKVLLAEVERANNFSTSRACAAAA